MDTLTSPLQITTTKALYTQSSDHISTERVVAKKIVSAHEEAAGTKKDPFLTEELCDTYMKLIMNT